MPVYEYQCDDCGRRFDVVATLAEKEAGLAPACPKCGKKRVRQVFSRFTLLASSKSDSGLDEDMGADSMGDAGFGGDDEMGDLDGDGADYGDGSDDL